MEIVYDDDHAGVYITRADRDRAPRTEHPVLVDRFLDDAIEIDVDALCDGERGLPRRRDGAHRGGRHPLRRLGLRAAADHAGRGRPGRGARHATGDGRPGRRARPAQRPVRAQGRRSVRAGGQPARLAGPCRSSPRRPRCRWPRRPPGSCSARPSPSCAPRACCRPPATAATCRPSAPIAVKEAVLPFKRFRTADGQGRGQLLGPEMKSTGEVMGIDAAFGHAFAKSQAAAYGVAADRRDRLRLGGQPGQAGGDLPDQAAGRPRLRRSWPPTGTAQVLRRHGIPARWSASYEQGTAGRRADDCVELIRAGEVGAGGQHPAGSPGPGPRLDGYEIRSAAVDRRHPVHHHGAGAAAAVLGIEALIRGEHGACARCRSCTPRSGRADR